MSGDVQPRKRKDKKKKKDDLGVEEPRGTAAALGEGDVFMHSYHDHGTGGHWCAKIIFFALLAVLVTLIGLIILENRGLTELEANSVESRYSGVLEGWIEDAVDDHHDEHTLELKHHDDEDHMDDQIDENEAEDESLEQEIEHDDDDSNEDDEHNDEMYDEDDESENEEDDEKDELDDDDDDSQGDDDDESHGDDGDETQDDDDDETQDDDDDENEYDNEENEDEDSDDERDEEIKYADNEDDEESYGRYSNEEIDTNIDEVRNGKDDDDDDGDDLEEQNYQYLSKELTSHYNNDDDESKEEDKYDTEKSYEQNNEDVENENEEDDDDVEEIEKIEKEVVDDSSEIKDIGASDEEEGENKDVEQDDSDEDEPPIEQISKPSAGKPFVEIEEETVVKPADTLAEEEAYERQQEELRRQEEQSSQSVWLKLCVGGALLAATHAVLRRNTVRNDPSDSDETMSEQAPTVIDRRMTIIEEPLEVTQSPTSSQSPRQINDEEVFKKPAPVAQSAIPKRKIEEEIVKKVVEKVLEAPKAEKTEEEKELYSEEEEEEDDEDAEENENEDVEEDNEPSEKEAHKEEDESEPEPEPEEVSDVEIIYDETVEEEEVEEEEISDVDDTELLNRLEAKYGRLPEPERPGQHKGGAKSVSSEWPGEPSDSYWRSQLDTAEEELRQGAWSACVSRVSVTSLEGSGRARWLRARALDGSAEAAHDNRMLSKAITAYLDLLRMNERLSDEKLLEVARRTIDRINFRGVYLNAEPVYRLLIRRFPDDVNYRNNLTVSFLMANRADLADEVLRETLRIWPNDRVALAHHGFVLKNHYNKLEEAVQALKKALEGDAGQVNEPRFYYHLGDALLLLGRFDEANEVHERGAELGHFLSPSQRSLYNVPRLRSKPWWRVEDTPYAKLARGLEASWRDILKEGEAAKTLYENEKEGLKERGEWSQMDIMVRGREIPGRCARAPITCSVVKAEAAAAGCKRGQVKFSMMAAGTHVRPHVGPTNCRLRMHLGLSNTKDTYIRVDKEIRQWQLGKTLLFDDSFEHEVWHNGTGTRLVLIVDVWHPDLTPAEKRQLPAI